MLEMAGPNTLRVDLAGKTVIPGVIDTHSHPNQYALRHYADEYLPIYLKFLEENRVRFATVRWDSKETALADFKRVAESLPPDYWIYSTGRLMPTTLYDIKKEDLDQVAPNNPLYRDAWKRHVWPCQQQDAGHREREIWQQSDRACQG